MRQHDEEHEGPDHLLVELLVEKCLTERMLYQVFELRLAQIREQGSLQSVVLHLVSLEDLGEVQGDDGLIFLHSDPRVEQLFELLHGPGNVLVDGLDDVVVLGPGVQLGSSLYEEPHILLSGGCKY